MVQHKSLLNTMSLVTISANNNFIKTLVNKFHTIYGKELNKAIFFMPTSLSADKLKSTFADINIKPIIFSLGNLDVNSIRLIESHLESEAIFLPEKHIISQTHRLMGLMHIAQNYIDLPFSDLQSLCTRILDIYDLMHIEGWNVKKIKRKLAGLQEYDEDNILRLWVSLVKYIEKNSDIMSIMSYRSFIIERISKIISSTKITLPIIIAGSTGSNYDMAALMNSILHIQKGYVVLPGYESNNINVATDPQYIMQQWVKKYAPSAKVDIWGGNNNLLSSVFSHNQKKVVEKIDHITTLECSSLYEEAESIVDIVMQNRDKSICIVTTHDFLKQKIISLLNTHKISLNYISSTSLINTDLGQLINSTLKCLANPSDIDDGWFFKKDDKLYKKFLELINDHKYLSINQWSSLHKQLIMEILNKSWDFTVKSHKKVSFTEYSSVIRHYLINEVTDEYINNNANLFLLESAHARLLDFDITIVNSMNEGYWPKALTNDSIMCYTIGLFGSPNISRRQSLTAHDIFMLLSKKNVILTRSKEDLAGASTASCWWQRFVLQNLVSNIQLSSLTQKEYKSLYKPSPSYSGVRGISNFIPNKISVTQIEKFIVDPYSLYVFHVLKLRPIDLFNNIDNLPARFGIIMHRLLEKFALLEGNYTQILEEVLLDNLSYLEKEYSDSFWYVNIWRQKLLDLERNITEFFSEIISHSEWQKTYVEKYVNWKLDDFNIYGFIDRVDLYDDKVVITDFKTGILPTKSMINSGKSIQLPLLARLLQEHSDLRRPNIYIRYMKIKKDNVIEVKELEDIGKYIVLAEQYSRLAIEYIKNPDSTFDSNNANMYSSNINSLKHLERYIV